MPPHIDQLYRAAMQADDLFQAALAAAYGKEACNARYDSRARATPTLARLAENKSVAYDAYRVAAFPHASR